MAKKVFDHQGIRKRRQAAGLTCEQLGFRIRRTGGQVQHLETGRSLPSVHTLFALAETFGVNAEDLFIDTPEPAELAA